MVGDSFVRPAGRGTGCPGWSGGWCAVRSLSWGRSGWWSRAVLGRERGWGKPRGGPSPPGCPRGERLGGCGLLLSLPPAASRGIAVELRPFLFRRFLPFSSGLPCGHPGPAPSCPASPSLPCGKGRARLPGATASAPGRALCGAGRGFAGEDPARLRHQLHCAGSGGGGRGRAPRCSYCAPPVLPSPPPPSPTPPKKKRSRGSEAHRCLHYIMSPPLPPGPRAPPGRGDRGAVRVAWLEMAHLLHGGARDRRGAASPLPGGCGGRAPASAARWRKSNEEGRLAAERSRG